MAVKGCPVLDCQERSHRHIVGTDCNEHWQSFITQSFIVVLMSYSWFSVLVRRIDANKNMCWCHQIAEHDGCYLQDHGMTSLPKYLMENKFTTGSRIQKEKVTLLQVMNFLKLVGKRSCRMLFTCYQATSHVDGESRPTRPLKFFLWRDLTRCWH